jgi:hypothetical protein
MHQDPLPDIEWYDGTPIDHAYPAHYVRIRRTIEGRVLVEWWAHSARDFADPDDMSGVKATIVSFRGLTSTVKMLGQMIGLALMNPPSVVRSRHP